MQNSFRAIKFIKGFKNDEFSHKINLEANKPGKRLI